MSELTPIEAARYCALRDWELWFDREDLNQPYAVVREDWRLFDWTWNDPLSIEMLDEAMASALEDGLTRATDGLLHWISSGRLVRVEVDPDEHQRHPTA